MARFAGLIQQRSNRISYYVKISIKLFKVLKLSISELHTSIVIVLAKCSLGAITSIMYSTNYGNIIDIAACITTVWSKLEGG